MKQVGLPSDEVLMQRYQHGDGVAFARLYQRCRGRVFVYLHKRLQDKQAVEDVLQNVFTKLHRTRAGYDPKYPVLAWLYTICRSELLDYVKKPTARCVELREDHAMCVPQVTDKLVDIDGEQRLTAMEKGVLKLRYFSEQDYRAIARQLGRSEAGVRKIGSRGLQKLRLKYAR